MILIKSSIGQLFLKRILKYTLLFKLVFISFLIFIIVHSVDLKEALSTFSYINYLILIPIFLYIPALLLSTYKWQAIIKYDFIKLFRIYWISNFFSNFLPSTIGGDGYRVIKLWKVVGRKNVLASVFIDRVTGLMGVLLLALVLSFSVIDIIKDRLDAYYIYWIGAAFVLLALGIYIIIFNKDKVGRLFDKFICEDISWGPVVTVSVLYPFLGAFSLWTYCYMFGYNVNFILLTEFYLIIQILSMIPVSINAIGVYELSLIGLLALVGVPSEISLGIAILSRLIMFFQTSVGGLLYLLEKK